MKENVQSGAAAIEYFIAYNAISMESTGSGAIVSVVVNKVNIPPLPSLKLSMSVVQV